MPKIIPNLNEALLNEAKKQIRQNGYAKTTIRSVASACGVGLGTVYNYFPSKDMLIASFMAEDWKICLEGMKCPASDEKTVLKNIYNGLKDFSSRYETLFSDKDAAKVFAAVFSQRHKQLRDQLANIILPFCQTSADGEFLSQFVAESLLTWTLADKGFEEQYIILSKLF